MSRNGYQRLDAPPRPPRPQSRVGGSAAKTTCTVFLTLGVIAAIVLGVLGTIGFGRTSPGGSFQNEMVTTQNLTATKGYVGMLTSDMLNTDMIIKSSLKISASGAFDPSRHYQQIDATSAIEIEMPCDLTALLGKEYTICTETAFPHKLKFPAGCGTTWDKRDQFRVLRMLPEVGTCAVFHAFKDDEVAVLSQDCVQYCDDNCTVCVGAMENTPIELWVGPDHFFKNVSDVINAYNGMNIGGMTIRMQPGKYWDNIRLDKMKTTAFLERVDINVMNEAFSIVGDDRAIVAQSYTNAAENPISNSVPGNWTVTVAGGAIGPFDTVPSEGFGLSPSLPYSISGPLLAADPYNACSALSNDLTGKIALVTRGTCAFDDKAANAEAAGAIAVILVNTVADYPFTPAGDNVPPSTILTVMGNSVTGAALLPIADGSTTVTIDSPIGGGSIIPPMGAPNGLVNMSHPGGDLSMLQIDVAGENPNFEGAGLIPGDQVGLTIVDSGDFLIAEIKEVVNVSGNVITFDSPISDIMTRPDSSIVFFPNVVLYPYESLAPSLLMRNSGARIRGIKFSSAPVGSAPNAVPNGASDTVYVTNSLVNMPNCVFSNEEQTSTNTLLTISSNVFSFDDGQYAPMASFLSRGIVVSSGSGLDCGTLALFSSLAGMSIQRNSHLRTLGRLTAVGSDYDTLLTEVALSVVADSSATVPTALFARNYWYGLFLEEGGRFFGDVSTVFKRNAIYSLFSGSFPILDSSAALAAIDGSQFRSEELTFEDNYGIPAFTSTASSVVSGSTYSATGNGLPAYASDSSTIEAYFSSMTGNIVPYSTSGTLEYAFKTHQLDSGPLTVTFTPDTSYTGSFPAITLAGREYKVINKDGSAHEIVLPNPAVFVGPGTSPGDNTVTFGGNAYECLDMRVIDQQTVLVCDAPAGATFSFTNTTMAKRRTLRTEIPPKIAKSAQDLPIMGINTVADVLHKWSTEPEMDHKQTR